MHGATYPASTAFDLSLDGVSWMEYIASRGYDVYLLDLRGYGKSTRPKEMAEDGKNNPPIVRGETAVKDIGTVVDFVLARRNIPRVNLLGWSWGTTLMATYTTQNNARSSGWCSMRRSWIRQTPSLVQAGPGPLPAYRMVSRDAALGRWITGVPEDKKPSLIPAGWFDAWADATWATDPEGAKMNPPVLRAPNGVVQDGVEFYGAGKAILRSGEDHGADAARARRMGSRHAALHGADAVSAVSQLARQTLRHACGRHAHDHHGEEPPQAVRSSPEVPRQGERVVGPERSSVGSKADSRHLSAIVRFTAESRHRAAGTQCPLGDNKGSSIALFDRLVRYGEKPGWHG